MNRISVLASSVRDPACGTLVGSPVGFSWEEGFGAFSYSHSQLEAVVRYIQNQQEHHRHKIFNEEYVALLKRFHVPHDQQFIFPASRSRLDAAPTELIAFCPIAIKMLLRRSMATFVRGPLTNGPWRDSSITPTIQITFHLGSGQGG